MRREILRFTQDDAWDVARVRVRPARGGGDQVDGMDILGRESSPAPWGNPDDLVPADDVGLDHNGTGDEVVVVGVADDGRDACRL